MGTTMIYGWFWGFAKSLYCRGVLKGEDRDSETRMENSCQKLKINFDRLILTSFLVDKQI